MQLPLFFARSTPKAGDRNADPLICRPAAFASGKTGVRQAGYGDPPVPILRTYESAYESGFPDRLIFSHP